MLPTIALLLASQQPDILKCRHDASGKLVVTKAQWEYVHKELDSWVGERAAKLIHPKLGVKVRVVDTAFPSPDGTIKVYRTKWTRADVIEKLQGARKPTYDINNPGYTYGVISRLTPGARERGTVTMKGTMLFLDQPLPPLRKDPVWTRYRKDLNRLSPTTYITLRCEQGRLWLAEVSSDSAGE